MLEQTYWAKDRSAAVIKASIKHALCYGAYTKSDGRQIAFARVITDYATAYYICDVVVDPAYRGYGIGKDLIHTAVNDRRLKNLRGMLITADAHGLYEKFGFVRDRERFMGREPAL